MKTNEIYSSFINSNSKFVIVENVGGMDDFPAVPHFHPQYEIYYSVKGCDGYCIEDRCLDVKPHDLIIIPKGAIHRAIKSKKSEYNAYIINFSDDIILNTNLIVENMGIDIVDGPLCWIKAERFGRDLPFKVHLNVEQHEKIITLFNECRNAEQRKDMLSVYTYFLAILILIDPLFNEGNFVGYEPYELNRWSDKVAMYVEKNFRNNNMSVQDIADALHVSHLHILEKFKEETNLTLNRFINIRRLVEAQKLLYKGALGQEVFGQVGYNNYSHFAKVFKKEIGCSPVDFKKNVDKAWIQNIPKVRPDRYDS